MNDEYDPKHLTRWTMPDNYAGELWPNYYSAGVGCNRDSDALERANFDAMVAALADDDGELPETVEVVRETHWACGWVQWIAIHQDDGDSLRKADEIIEGLQDYPIIDESLYSEYELDECIEVWENCFDWQDRLQHFREHSYIDGPGNFRDLLRAVRGDWCAAANLLHSPSDLLH